MFFPSICWLFQNSRLFLTKYPILSIRKALMMRIILFWRTFAFSVANRKRWLCVTGADLCIFVQNTMVSLVPQRLDFFLTASYAQRSKKKVSCSWRGNMSEKCSKSNKNSSKCSRTISVPNRTTNVSKGPKSFAT